MMSLPQDPPGPQHNHAPVRVTDDWYIVARSSAVLHRPLPIMLHGVPIVVFRDKTGRVGALLDRCPHRNVPLSLGSVRGETLQCAYHGWEFDRSGGCRLVPGLMGDPAAKGRRAASFAVREGQGFVWVYASPDVRPVREPFRFPLLEEKGYTTVRQEMLVDASVHATAENALDVPHTAYLHGGLFRSSSGERREIEVVVRRLFDRVEAEYMGESRPRGLVGRILAPRGGEVKHVDRFILPSVAQVEYMLGDDTHICVTTTLTPVHDFRTHLFSVVSLRLPIPGWLLTPVLKPIVMRIFKQDAAILHRQTETIRLFGGEQFHSTAIDVLGGHIARLLKQAKRGERDSRQPPVVSRLRMIV
jgi:phenylpropionate dioxygenase-like ring-hydroxylating dioxygenase large terminal subunit